MPWLGRWTTSDPIGLQGGLNGYGYCRGDPVGKVDPSGRTPVRIGTTTVSSPQDEVRQGLTTVRPAEAELRIGKTTVTSPEEERGQLTTGQQLEAGGRGALRATTGFGSANEVKEGLDEPTEIAALGVGLVSGPLMVLPSLLGTAYHLGEDISDAGNESLPESVRANATGSGVARAGQLVLALVGLRGAAAAEASMGGPKPPLGGPGSPNGGGPGGGSTTFLHGGQTASIDAMAAEGGGIKPVSTATHKHPAGSFFTHEASQPDAHFAASQWPLVQGKASSAGVSVLEMSVPNATLQELQSQGLVRTGPVPGLPGFPQETVFHPGALETLNQTATFRKIPPQF